MTRDEIQAALAKDDRPEEPWCPESYDAEMYRDIAEWERERADIAIGALHEAWAEIDRLREQYARIVVKTKRFEEGNCPICRYNGPGYFQPDKHPCAKYYHETVNPSLDQALNEGDGAYRP